MFWDVRWQSLAKGTASFLHPAFRSSWHAEDRYRPEHFYQIFLRHYLHAAPLLPQSSGYKLAELGPGDSIGTGLAALIAGAGHYTALDVENLLDVDRNLATFDRLVELFRTKAPPSNRGDFVTLFPFARSEEFPPDLAANLSWSLAPERLAAIRADVVAQSGRFISVSVPWRRDALPASSVDWLLTHAVLEHMDDVDDAYRCFQAWLRPGGVMTHLIDFFSHGLTKAWNGHWCINDFTWTLMRGRRYWLINRLPLSYHLSKLRENNFELAEQLMQPAEGGRERSRFARRFRDIPELDSRTRMAFLVSTAAAKTANAHDSHRKQLEGV